MTPALQSAAALEIKTDKSSHFLSKFDADFLLGLGPKVVSSEPMIRLQGNGKFTGFVRHVYSDGIIADAEFVVNASSREDVIAAYATSGMVV